MEMTKAEKRSVSQQILFLAKNYLAKKPRCDAVKTPSEVLLELYGLWQDERKADQIIDQIKKAHKNTKKSEAAFLTLAPEEIRLNVTFGHQYYHLQP
jgi:hypothetical protein